MLERKRVLSVGYYAKGATFTGNDKFKHYKLEKITDEESGEKNIKTTVWPGPFCLDKTDDSLKQIKIFEFSEDGIVAAVDWINSIVIEKPED